MKKFIILVILSLSIVYSFGQSSVLHVGENDWPISVETYESQMQSKVTTTACGTPFLSTGYPAWTNYWAGWMVNIINTNICPIVISGFEARFQGTAGYRIYTKTGTFVGFETIAGAWALVGNVAALTGTSIIAPTSIPIVVSVTIPVGGTQGFYLTRSDNLIANRHLYVPGAGIAGTTVYSSNADISITEGSYVDPYFAALQIGVRRPSFDVCYSTICPLFIEMTSFSVNYSNGFNLLKWSTSTEVDNDYFLIERSSNAIDFDGLVKIKGAGNSNQNVNYSYVDDFQLKGIVYYRLKTVSYDGKTETSNVIAIESKNSDRDLVKITNIIGQEVESGYSGIVFVHYSNGTVVKKLIN